MVSSHLRRQYPSLINLAGHFPGPVIEARSGDEIVVDVYNGLADNEGTAFHWHGLSMRGAISFLLSFGLDEN